MVDEEREKPFPFFQLAPEVQSKVIDYLDGTDILILLETSSKFEEICTKRRSLTFHNSENTFSRRPKQVTDFMPKVRPERLKRLDLSGCYWISSTDLVSWIINYTKLESLFVVETQLDLDDLLKSIFPVCKGIKELSFTLRVNQANFVFTEDQKKALQNLEHLEMMVTDSCEVKDLQFLVMCTELRKLVVPRSPLLIFNFPFQPVGINLIFPHLEFLVFIVGSFPAGMTLVRQFVDVETQGSMLTTLWSNVLDCLNVENKNFQSLCWNFQEVRAINLEEDYSLATLESVWEPKPIFLNAPNVCTKLKSASMYFNGQFWLEFCKSHALLKELKLMFPPRNEGVSLRRATPAAWNVESWSKLQNLRKLSIDASLIKQNRAVRVEQQAKRSRVDDDVSSMPGCSRPAFLAVVCENCPRIQELEVYGEPPENDPAALDPDGRRGTKIDVGELSAIALLGSSLEKLTLANLDVEDGLFFNQIFKENVNLKSIRLKDIGPSASCCYSATLITALPAAKQLETFCIFQRFVPFEEMVKLMGALESCTMLQRVSLVSPIGEWRIGRAALHKIFVRFCQNLPHLVGLFGHLYALTNNFASLNDILANEFRTKRPAFRADIQCPPRPRRQARVHGQVNVAEMFDQSQMQDSYKSQILPLCHSDVLCHIPSQVGIFPLNCDSFVQHM